MKIRSDYVSNSSSCSFYVYLDTDEDVNEFNKIMNSLEDVFKANLFAGWQPNPSDMSILTNSRQLDKDTWICVDCGDDTLENIEKFEDVKDFIEEHPYKFKTYRDDLAHSTFGEDIPEEEHERW